MDVKYLGDGSTVIVLGEGQPRQSDDGRGNVSEHATTRVVRLDPTWIEELESDAVLDKRPELHPDTGRPLSDTEEPKEPEAAQEEYTDNGDGTYTRESDGAHGTFGPEGFKAAEGSGSGRSRW